MPAMRKSAIALCSLLFGGALSRESEHDFVIVGGGLAGTILANRLSASSEHSVLLLNIGGAPPSGYSSPALVADEFITVMNKTYTPGMKLQIKQPGYKDMQAFASETGSSPARWLGGSSLVSLSLYLRDHPEAIDTWGEGWTHEELKPYFTKAEKLEGRDFQLAESDYGTEGAYTIQEQAAFVHPLTWDFVRASGEVGLPYAADLNTLMTASADAVGLTPTAQHKDGTKTHAYDAYLRPAMHRKNLMVMDGVRADELLIHEGKCHGVAFKRLSDGTMHEVRAKREVIVSSGYVYSPRLLFLSGLGDRKELKKAGVKVVKHLPAVGKNLTAARFTPLSWETPEPSLSQILGAPISAEGAEPNAASFASAVSEATARFRTATAALKDPLARRPDVAISFQPLYYEPHKAPLQFSLQGETWPLKTNAYSLLVHLGETKAQGALEFSGSAEGSPVLTHEPLTDPEDLARAADAVRMARSIGGSAALGRGGAQKFIENGAGETDMWSAVYDGRGSCRMGKHEHDSVVDKHLKVHGVRGLRVVDGSVIPQGSPYLSGPEVTAVAERASDLILQEHKGDKRDRAPAQTIDTGIERQYDTFSIATLTGILGPKMTLLDACRYLASEQEPATKAAPPELAAVPLAPAAAAAALALSVAALAAVVPCLRASRPADADEEYAAMPQ